MIDVEGVKAIIKNQRDAYERLVATPDFDQGTTIYYKGKLEAAKELLKLIKKAEKFE